MSTGSFEVSHDGPTVRVWPKPADTGRAPEVFRPWKNPLASVARSSHSWSRLRTAVVSGAATATVVSTHARPMLMAVKITPLRMIEVGTSRFSVTRRVRHTVRRSVRAARSQSRRAASANRTR
jgi:hypothetical protein